MEEAPGNQPSTHHSCSNACPDRNGSLGNGETGRLLGVCIFPSVVQSITSLRNHGLLGGSIIRQGFTLFVSSLQCGSLNSPGILDSIASRFQALQKAAPAKYPTPSPGNTSPCLSGMGPLQCAEFSSPTPNNSNNSRSHAACEPPTPPPSDVSASENEKNLEWNGAADPENPFNWPNRKKWRVTLLACFMTFLVQLNGTMMTSAAEQINESFGVSDKAFPHSYWPVLSWNLGGAAAPMLGLPLMENFGVRWSYLVSICIYR
jgi:hypothetical protein